MRRGHRSIGWVTIGPCSIYGFAQQVERCECGHPIRTRSYQRGIFQEARDEMPRWENEGGAL